MRTDQYAYQQATRIAGLGLILQLAIGLVLFVVGSAVGSTAFVQGSTIKFVVSKLHIQTKSTEVKNTTFP